MAKTFVEMMADFRRYRKNFLLQSLLATVSLFCVLVLLGQQEVVFVASIGATTFIVFTLPDKFTAQPRNVIGGHVIGLLCGAAAVKLLTAFPDLYPTLRLGVFALAVGIAMFIMIVFDMEHPPAAGTALGIAVEGFTMQMALGVVFCAVVLTLIRLLLRPWLRDLA